MSINRYDRHRAILATPESREQELSSARGVCFFYGLMAVIEAAFSRSLVPLTLVAAAVVIVRGVAANHKRASILTLGLVTAITATVVQVIAIIFFHQWRFFGALIGLLLMVVAQKARQIAATLDVVPLRDSPKV